MAAFDISEPLGPSSAASSATFTNSNFLFDFAIGGLPFLSAARDETPYERGFAQVRREQLDTAQVAGEQSLSAWWLRSQYTFTGGAGQRNYEPASDEAVRTGYKSSQGVNPWVDGELQLLRETSEFSSAAGSRIAGARSGSTNYVVYLDGSASKVWNGSTSATVTGSTGTHSWLWPIGGKVLAAHSAGIDIIDVASNSATSMWTGMPAAPKVWWVKNRIIAAAGSRLYELPYVTTATSVASSTYEITGVNTISSWTWTGAVETPNSILVSGYSGSKGAIYALTLESDGGLVTLAAPAVAAEFPQGEWPTGMMSYVGAYVASGTNKGVRLGVVDGNGRIQYGPLSVETASAVEHFTASDRFIYAGVSAGQPDGTSGLIRLDVGGIDQAGRAPWAFDVAAGDTGPVTGVTQFGSSGRMVVASSKIWLESATTLVESGWLETSDVLFGTLEPKQFHYAKPSLTVPGGTVAMAVGGVNLYTYDGANSSAEPRMPSAAVDRASLTFTLSRDGTDSSVGPTVEGWQMKALPVVQRQELISIPLMCYVTERDRAGNEHTTDAWARYARLAALCASQATVTYQNLGTGEQATVVVEDLGFRQLSPPDSADGFGGTVTVTVRKI